jgi:hypothetical protein
MSELREEDKPACFGCYGYRICDSDGGCKWERRCYYSQRDT